MRARARAQWATALLALLVLLAGPAAATTILNYDLSDSNIIGLTTATSDYSVTLDQPVADPSFNFTPGDVIHMSGRTTFNELFGGSTALLVFTSFRQAPSYSCGATAPPLLGAAPGADINTDPSTYQTSSTQSNPNGSICSSELGAEPFLTLVFENAAPGQEREFLFDLVLTEVMDANAGLRVLYKGYSAVPEPSTALLLGLGLIGIAVQRNRR